MITTTTFLNVDNTAAIAPAAREQISVRNKHIDFENPSCKRITWEQNTALTTYSDKRATGWYVYQESTERDPTTALIGIEYIATRSKWTARLDDEVFICSNWKLMNTNWKRERVMRPSIIDIDVKNSRAVTRCENINKYNMYYTASNVRPAWRLNPILR